MNINKKMIYRPYICHTWIARVETKPPNRERAPETARTLHTNTYFNILTNYTEVTTHENMQWNMRYVHKAKDLILLLHILDIILQKCAVTLQPKAEKTETILSCDCYWVLI